SEGRLALLMVAFAASGAGALVLEVVWTRLLSLILGSSTQAFTIMLTTFLAGLALGSTVATRWLHRVRHPLFAFALIELGAGLTAYLGVYLFPELPYAFLWLFKSTDGPSALFHAGRFGLAALVMLLPTLFLGAAFPIAARAALAGRPAVSAPVATLYAANTIGAIVGACAAGFRFIPALGLQGTLVMGCLLNLAVAALLLAASPSGRPAVRWSLAGLLVVCLPGLLVGTTPWNGSVMTTGVFQYAKRYMAQFPSRRQFMAYHETHPQLYYRDGPTTTVTVERRQERFEGKVNMVLSVNGKVDASSTGDMDTQVLSGHLPLLASPGARSVMVIGLASGVSAGSVLTHPVESLTVVEIEPAMIEAQSYFQSLNNMPLQDPRTRLRLDDARNELLVSDRTYDVIISEPSNPWLAGPSKLFTREFFQQVTRRLRPGGILCQWVQLYGMDVPSLQAVLRTFASVFPHRLVFKGSPGDLLVLGSAEPITLDTAAIRARMAEPRVAADLQRVHVDDLDDVLFRFRLAGDSLIRFTGPLDEGPLNTDDNGLVEFAAARTLYRENDQANDAVMTAIPDVVVPHVKWSSQDEAARTAASLAVRLVRAGVTDRAAALLDAMLASTDLTPQQRAAFLATRGDLLHKHGKPEEALASWREAVSLDPSQPRAAIGLAAARLADHDTAGAVSLLKPAGASPAAAVELARIRWQSGDPTGAVAALDAVEPPGTCSGSPIGHDPDAGPLIHLYRGRILQQRGDVHGAIGQLELFFALSPGSPRSAEVSIEAAAELARAYLTVGNTTEALARFRMAAGMADSLASWNRQQAERLIPRRELETAAKYLRASLQWNAQDNVSRRLLALVLNDLERNEEALGVWYELDRALEGDPEALRNIAGLSLEMKRPADAMEALRKLTEVEADPVEMERAQATLAQLIRSATPAQVTGEAP
ncbi:MAG: fused MFS/spermidine synthase, partial [Candidatus Polarisedimenticolia bacterium]